MDSQHRFKGPGELVSRQLVDAHSLWAQVANGRLGPTRDELTPAVIRGLLPSVYFMDVIGQGEDFRFRFAGDRVIQFMGRRYAGLLLSEFRGAPIFEAMHQIFSGCVRARRAVANGPMRSTHEPKNFLEMEVLVMPMSEDGTNVTALFGGLDTWPLGTNKS
ncbi:MAG: PAS domain-containing protein [Proteobacteria bacterium]|nr:PAS domain-containing protein [Pseudomonadota bacterium]